MNQREFNTGSPPKGTAQAATAEPKAAFPKDPPTPEVLLRLPDAQGRPVFEFRSDGVIIAFNPVTGTPAVMLGNLADPAGDGGFVTVLNGKGCPGVEIETSDLAGTADGCLRVYADNAEIIRLGDFKGFPAEGLGYDNHRSRGLKVVGPDGKEVATLSTVLPGTEGGVAGGGFLVLNTPNGNLGLVADAHADGRSDVTLFGESDGTSGNFPYVTVKADDEGGGLKVYQGRFGPNGASIPFTVGAHSGG